MQSQFEEPQEDIRRRLADTGAWNGRISHRTRDGATVVVASHWTVKRDEAGNRIATVEVNNDITQLAAAERELELHRRDLEELVRSRTWELEQSRQLAQSASQAKGTFLANMSHEIRTPLNAIIGMSHLIKRGGLPAEQVGQLDQILLAGEHLLEIINTILELSKIESGKLLIERVPLNVESIVATTMSMVQERAREKGLQLTVEASSLPSSLLGDPVRIKQCLLNYISNAVKFTNAGQIVLRVRMVEETAEGALLRFEVVDSGVGIAPEVLPRLFTIFEQGDNSATRHYGGTGLGLAITRQLAQLMGGDAGAESALNIGSTFWFSARLQRPASEAAVSAELAESDAEARLKAIGHRHRVLLVEDEPMNLKLATIFLTDVGLNVETAVNGLEAIRSAGSASYSLILMDMQMPTMGGLQAAREIRQLPGHETTPILAMTGNAFAEDRIRCFDAGMNDFIAKPFKPKELYATVFKWLAARVDEPPIDSAHSDGGRS